MKRTHLLKRSLSLLLSVILVFTSLEVGGINWIVAEAGGASCDIRYIGINGAVNSQNPTHIMGTDLNLNAISKDGYIFLGWTGPGIAENEKLTSGTISQSIFNGILEATYTAHWQAKEELMVSLQDWVYLDMPNTPVLQGYNAERGNISPVYTYYIDRDCKQKTNTECGAAGEGEVPTKIGKYYIKAEIPEIPEASPDYIKYPNIYATSEFEIKPIQIPESMFNIKVDGVTLNSGASYILIDYDDKEHQVTYELSYPKDWKYGNLTLGTDYDVKYTNDTDKQTDVGSYSVEFKAKGLYTGEFTKNWKISDKQTFDDITAIGFEGCPDGKSHSIKINGVPDDAVIKYGTKEEGIYDLDKNPEFTEGDNTVYFKVSKEHYEDYEAFAKITLVHTFDKEFTIDKEPTCEEDGVKSRHCIIDGCDGKGDVTVLDKLGHGYTSEIITEPTCTSEGLKRYYCSHDSKHNYDEILPELGHDWSGEWKTIIEPTDLVDGVAEKICKNGKCGLKTSKKLPALTKEQDDGSLSVGGEVTKEAPIEYAYINNDVNELLNESNIFTADEKKEIANNKNGRLYVKIDAVNKEEISKEVENKVNEYILNNLGENYTKEFFDASLFKQIGNNAPVKINEVDKEVSIKLHLPDRMICKDKMYNREYSVLRFHNDKVSEARNNFDGGSCHLEVDSSYFSTFVIVYRDVKAGIPLIEGGIASVKLSKTQYIYSGKENRPLVTVNYYDHESDTWGNNEGKKKIYKLKENVDYIVSYENNIKAGVGKVIITGIGDYAISETKEFSILKKDNSKWKTEAGLSFKYDGNDIKDSISANLIVKDAGYVVNSKDYIIDFDGDTVNPGNIKITVTAAANGNYRNNKTLVTNVSIIENSSYDLSQAEIKLKKNKKFVYSGKAFKPAITVKLNGKKLSSKYYSVIYKNNINAGEATAYVIGKGKAAGKSAEIKFTIEPQDISKVKVKKFSDTYWRSDIASIKPIVSYRNIYLEKDKDYTIEVININQDEFKEKLSKDKKVPVDVIIRPTKESINFVDKSPEQKGKVKKIFITKRSLKSKFCSASEVESVLDKDGKLAPKITLTYLNDVLIQDVDYTLKVKKRNIKHSSKHDINVEKLVEATITVKGIGLYQGKSKFKCLLGREF